jgi:hypothetical protein
MGSALEKGMPEYIQIPEPGERAKSQEHKSYDGDYRMRSGKNVMNEGENRSTQFRHLVIVVGCMLAVAYSSGMQMTVPAGTSHHIMGLHLRSNSAPTTAHAGQPLAECVCPEGRASSIIPGPEKDTVMVKLPRDAKPGQLLHVYVPDHHDEMVPVRVPRNAKVGFPHSRAGVTACLVHIRISMDVKAGVRSAMEAWDCKALTALVTRAW